jgi:hypothetical protein
LTTKYAVHHAWIDGHAQKGPVGIWDEFGNSYYPQATATHQPDGAASFHNRGQHDFHSWLAMRVDNPSTYGPSWEEVTSSENMKSLIESVVANFLSTVQEPLVVHLADAAEMGQDVPAAQELTDPNRSDSAFNYIRVGPPEPDDALEMHAPIGGQFEWLWAVPHVMHALHTPARWGVVPRAPLRGASAPDAPVLGYWAALQYVLTYSLGWARHDRGLRSWYDAGKPTDTPSLNLLSDVWDADGNLDAYVWWSHTEGRSAGYPLLRDTSLERRDLLDEHWERRLETFKESALISQGVQASLSAPHPAGLHLEMGSHLSNWEDEKSASSGSLWVKSPLDRTALFESSDLRGWHTRLSELGNTLDHDKSKSWHVDVYVKNVGFLGTYRRSWVTGLWFAGPHRYHSMGSA